MTIVHMAILFSTALLGGALNSVAGGGSFLTFPSLIFTGVSPINANATSTVALWPGTLASTGAYRRELGQQKQSLIILMGAVSLVGGILGALLLLHTSQSTFTHILPFLLLIATALFAFSSWITVRLRAMMKGRPSGSLSGAIALAATQLVIATYGGYFGGGIGILMLAALSLIGMTNIHDMNALKTVFASCINGVAVITFALAGAVVWPQATVMVAGAIVGGYGGAYFARQIDPRLVRKAVIVVGVAMTLYFFVKQS